MSVVISELKNNVCTLIINRPDHYNALNINVLNELNKNIEWIENEKKCLAVILTGAGEKAFIAGADIKAMSRMDFESAQAFSKFGQDLTLRIENLRVPVIAAVNGFALGGGCEISLACHIRVASDNAVFGQPEVLLGLIPGWGGTQRLPKIVGTGIANELITTGKQIAAEEAHKIGLANHVVPQDELMDTCKKIAQQILKNGPNAIAQSLSCVYAGYGKSISEGMEEEVNAFAKLFETDETKEGLTAFVEKRKANFR